MQQGITSYKHLNKVIVEVLIEKDKEMAAREIYDVIMTNYSTDKIRLNAVKIAKRLKGRDNITIRHAKDGLCYYRYIKN